MPKWVISSFIIFSLLLFRVAESRAIISPDSDSHQGPVHHDDHHNPSSSHIIAPPEQSGMKDDDGNCKGLDKEECLVRKTMIAHTDYIYTQGINGP